MVVATCVEPEPSALRLVCLWRLIGELSLCAGNSQEEYRPPGNVASTDPYYVVEPEHSA